MGTGYRRQGVVVVMAVVSLLASMMVGAQPAATAAPPERIGIAYQDGANWFDEGVAAGVARAANEYKLKVFDEFLIDESGLETAPSAVLTNLAKKRPDLVLAVGFGYTEAIGAAAAAYPKTNFAGLDVVPEPLAPNSQGVMFATNEGSFLVGAAAALTSTSAKVGFIGGEEIPILEPFEAGFVAGVEHINPAATVEVAYAGSFANPEAAYEIAMGMYASGIDVIYGAAGGSTFGVLEAAADYSAGNPKVWMIGVDSDFYEQVDASLQPFVLTSMVKRLDVAAYETIKAQVTGTFSGGIELFDLARDGVDYTTSGGFVDEFVPTLEGLRQDIIDGVITVPAT